MARGQRAPPVGVVLVVELGEQIAGFLLHAPSLVAGQVVTVTQSQGCTPSITPVSQSVAANGGTGNIAVATEAGCVWSAESNASWIAITAGKNGNGPGAVAFATAASTGPARSGTLTVAGQTFTVTQASGCSYTLAPASQDVSDGAGTATNRWAAGIRAPPSVHLSGLKTPNKGAR